MNIRRFSYPASWPQPPFGEGEIHLWSWTLGGIPESQKTLSAGERARAQSMGSEKVQACFVTCRARTRAILATYVGTPPGELIFEVGPEGKPATEGIEFNLSHSGDHAMLAVSRAPVGVDIETVNRESRHLEVAGRFFQPSEIELIGKAQDQAAMFFRLWTAKEALIKAMGTGAFKSLHAIEIAEGPEGLHVVRLPEESRAGLDWKLVSLDPKAIGMAACLAYGRAQG